jgi:hypothetical protein
MLELLELKEWHAARTGRPARDAADSFPEDASPGYDRASSNSGAGRPEPFLDEYIPTPEEIRTACREIQSGWSEAERRRRSGLAHPRRLFRIRTCRTAFYDR